MKSMLFIRWIMVGITFVLVALLIERGNVVIGVVLGLLAVARVALLVRMQQRREQFRQRFEQRRAARGR